MAINLFNPNYYRLANPDLANFNDAQAFNHSKKEDGFRFRSFKIQGVLNGSLEAAARCQFDIEGIPSWYMNVTEAKLLKRVSDTEYYFYFYVKMPFGVPHRDVVVRAKIQPYSTKTGFLAVSYTAVPDFIPSKAGVIRMPAYETTTKFTPINENQTEEQLEGYVDPGGRVPSWAANFVQHSAPYSVALGSLRMVKKDEYAKSNEPIPFPIYNYQDYLSKQLRGQLPQ